MSHYQLKLGYIEHIFNNVYIINGSYFFRGFSSPSIINGLAYTYIYFNGYTTI